MDVKERAERWLDPVFDADTRTRVQELLKEGELNLLSVSTETSSSEPVDCGV